MDDDTPAPSELLADELIAACIGHLTLHSLPCVARVNRRWRAAALVAFDSQLRWRADPRCFPLRLPIPAAPARAESHVARAGACIAFLRDGDLVVQLVDPAADAVRTLRFAERRPVDGDGPPEPVEACRCEITRDHPRSPEITRDYTRAGRAGASWGKTARSTPGWGGWSGTGARRRRGWPSSRQRAGTAPLLPPQSGSPSGAGRMCCTAAAASSCCGLCVSGGSGGCGAPPSHFRP